MPATEEVAVEEISYGPLTFDWQNDAVTTRDSWPAKKKEILEGIAEGKILRIVGPYFKDEVNNTSFDNLGLARADRVKQLLLDSIIEEKMETGSKLIDFFDGAKVNPFEGVDISWVVRNENVKEIDNKALFYFPYNSTQKLDNSNINNYLKDVAKSLEGNDKKVYLTGHTDNKGNSEYNHELGLNRANAIKETLTVYGVDPARIIVDSKGETEPIASNDTEEGKQQNRRVELIIK